MRCLCENGYHCKEGRTQRHQVCLIFLKAESSEIASSHVKCFPVTSQAALLRKARGVGGQWEEGGCHTIANWMQDQTSPLSN